MAASQDRTIDSINFDALALPPFNMTPRPLSDAPVAQLYPAPQNTEVMMGLFIGQLPRSVTSARVRNLLITLSNIVPFLLRIYHVDIHHRSGSCAFATVNQSAALVIVRMDKCFALDANHLWLAENDLQRSMMCAFLSQQNAVPRKPIVLELRGVPNAPLPQTTITPALYFPTQGTIVGSSNMLRVAPFSAQSTPNSSHSSANEMQTVFLTLPPLQIEVADLSKDVGAAACVPSCQPQTSQVPEDCLLFCAECHQQVTTTASICAACLRTVCLSCASSHIR